MQGEIFCSMFELRNKQKLKNKNKIMENTIKELEQRIENLKSLIDDFYKVKNYALIFHTYDEMISNTIILINKYDNEIKELKFQS